MNKCKHDAGLLQAAHLLRSPSTVCTTWWSRNDWGNVLDAKTVQPAHDDASPMSLS